MTSVGHHSTSDDSFAYRARAEVEDRKRIDNPITRLRLFLESQGWWNNEAETELKGRIRADVMAAFKRAESLQRHELNELFSDVYSGQEPWHIVSDLVLHQVQCLTMSAQKEQRAELSTLLKKYGNVWEPWKNELKKYKGEGKELMSGDGP